MGGICPLHHLLAELCSLSPANYHMQLVAWLQRHLLYLKCASKWVHACDLEMENYYDHLQWDGLADGLEVLLVSLSINVLINIVLDDVVWTLAKQDLNFQNPTILISIAGAQACVVHDSLAGNLGDMDTTVTIDSVECDKSKDDLIPKRLLQRPEGGHPLISTKENVSDSGSTTDTNLDIEYTKTIVLHVKGRTWKVTPQLCRVCRVGVKSKAALVFHLKQCHPDS